MHAEYIHIKHTHAKQYMPSNKCQAHASQTHTCQAHTCQAHATCDILIVLSKQSVNPCYSCLALNRHRRQYLMVRAKSLAAGPGHHDQPILSIFYLSDLPVLREVNLGHNSNPLLTLPPLGWPAVLMRCGTEMAESIFLFDCPRKVPSQAPLSHSPSVGPLSTDSFLGSEVFLTHGIVGSELSITEWD